MSKSLIVTLIMAVSASSFADQCEVALLPTVEVAKTDYRIQQAYMYANADSEYDRLQKLDTTSRSADATFKVFTAEYNDSNSSQEFREKVRNRLTREQFNLNESDARQYYRRFLSDAQLTAWSSCISQGDAGGLLLSVKNI